MIQILSHLQIQIFFRSLQNVPPNDTQVNTTYKPQITTQTETMSLPDISKEYRLDSGDIILYAWSGDFIERNISKIMLLLNGYIQLPIVGSVRIGNLTTSKLLH